MHSSNLLGSLVITSEGILTRYFSIGKNISQKDFLDLQTICNSEGIQLLPHSSRNGVYCLDPAKLRAFEKKFLPNCDKEYTQTFAQKENAPQINLHINPNSPIPHPFEFLTKNNDTMHIRRYDDLQINTYKVDIQRADTIAKMDQICWDLKTKTPPKQLVEHYGACHVLQIDKSSKANKYEPKDLQVFVNYCASHGIDFKKCVCINQKTGKKETYFVTTDMKQVSKLYDEISLNLRGISPKVQEYRCDHGFQKMRLPIGAISITSEGVLTRSFDIGQNCSETEFNYLRDELYKEAGITFMKSKRHANRYYLNPEQLTKFENYVGEKDSYTSLLSVFDSHDTSSLNPACVSFDRRQHSQGLMAVFYNYCKKNGLTLHQEGSYFVTSEREKFEQLRQCAFDQSFGKGVLKGQFNPAIKKGIFSSIFSGR